MSGNKMSKISHKTLFEYIQFWRKGAVNYSQKCCRKLNFSDKTHAFNIKDSEVLSHEKSELPQCNIPHNIYERNSPTSIIVQQNALCSKNTVLEKRYEFDLAALKQKKCNEILKDYFAKPHLQQLKVDSDSNKFPEMVTKLTDIISPKVLTTQTKLKPKEDSTKKHSGNKGNYFDFKPQTNINLNRWHIKFPTPRELRENKPNDHVNPLKKLKQTKQELPGAVDKVDKKSTCISTEDSDEIDDTEEFWQLGSVSIPRLDV